jgi:hypothetical protein
MLRYLLDENLRGMLWRFVVRHNARGGDRIDVVRVGDPGAVPLGTSDPDLLRWCEINERVLVSHDKNTVPGYLREHLATGHQSPGVFLVRDVHPADVVEYLVVAALASDASEWRDQYFYIP